MSAKTQKAVLLVNLGSPKKATPWHVFWYLREFLMDPWVLDIPYFFRFLLVHILILPQRSFRSAAAYKKIWTKRGSPLLLHTFDMAQKAQLLLGDGYSVHVAMRYQKPDIKNALKNILAKGFKEIILFPLYPQYTTAATQTVLAEITRVAQKIAPKEVHFAQVPAFYNNQGFLLAWEKRLAQNLAEHPSDYVLFSFHGLPENQIRQLDYSHLHCFEKTNCCDQITNINQHCYRAQCFATANALAEKLKLPKNRFGISFQSRLGTTRWIEPYTDQIFRKLAFQGVKHLTVVCPSFVADCLETLEEIQIRGREQFLSLGGSELYLVPSLNASDAWCQALAELCRKASAL